MTVVIYKSVQRYHIQKMYVLLAYYSNLHPPQLLICSTGLLVSYQQLHTSSNISFNPLPIHAEQLIYLYPPSSLHNALASLSVINPSLYCLSFSFKYINWNITRFFSHKSMYYLSIFWLSVQIILSRESSLHPISKNGASGQ